MKNKNNKISVAEIDKMINEEIAKIRKIEKIKSRLAIVNEELSKLTNETVDEVSVGGVRNGEEWYEKGTPVAKFEKKGTHLKEEDPMLDDMDAEGMGDELGGEELGGDDSVELDGDELGVGPVAGTFEEKMAAIGRELDMQLSGVAPEEGDDLEVADDTMEEPAAEMEMDAEEESDSTEETPADDEDTEDAEIEIDEVAGEEECEDAPMMNESVDRLGKKKNPLLTRELERMKRLSGF